MKKDYKKLELDKILDLLSQNAYCDVCRERIKKIKPSFDIDTVRTEIAKTDDAFTLSSKFGTPKFYNIKDICFGAKRAQQGSSLSLRVSHTGKPIKAKTVGQSKYVNSIKKNTIVFGVGPAGTGKTYLAVALAVRAFKAHEVQRIILTRPAVEAGEKLGFLPGDLQNKVDPYLRPLYDALFDMMGSEAFQRNMERGCIEVAPLAYMRGRTLDDSFIILDEAQNTTPEQMKMFLTRLGFNSKMVITGDITQIDLPDSKRSGLVEATKILKNIEDIAINRFTEKDVVRHRLVQDIVRAYEQYNERKKS